MCRPRMQKYQLQAKERVVVVRNSKTPPLNSTMATIIREFAIPQRKEFRTINHIPDGMVVPDWSGVTTAMALFIVVELLVLFYLAPVFIPIVVGPCGCWWVYRRIMVEVPVKVTAEDAEYFNQLMERLVDPRRRTQNDVDRENEEAELAAGAAAGEDGPEGDHIQIPVDGGRVEDLVAIENRGVIGRQARVRRRIAHRGLFDIVDYGKAYFPANGDSRVHNANRLVVRDYLRKEMIRRRWRNHDIASWIELAVTLVLTPTEHDAEAALADMYFGYSGYRTLISRLNKATSC